MESGKLISQVQALFVAVQAEYENVIAIHIRMIPTVYHKKIGSKCRVSVVLEKGLGKKAQYLQWEFRVEKK